MIHGDDLLIHGDAKRARWRQLFCKRTATGAKLGEQIGDGHDLRGQHKRLAGDAEAFAKAGEKYQLDGHAPILGSGAIVNSLLLK